MIVPGDGEFWHMEVTYLCLGSEKKLERSLDSRPACLSATSQQVWFSLLHLLLPVMSAPSSASRPLAVTLLNSLIIHSQLSYMPGSVPGLGCGGSWA